MHIKDNNYSIYCEYGINAFIVLPIHQHIRDVFYCFEKVPVESLKCRKQVVIAS